MKIGYWLDWNSKVDEEFETNHMYLTEIVFDRPARGVLLKNISDLAQFDGDLLTFDFGGITGGYGPNEVVPRVLENVREWCEGNPDRLAMVWCTFPAKFYREYFEHDGGVPRNLRFWEQRKSDDLAEELRRHYAEVA